MLQSVYECNVVFNVMCVYGALISLKNRQDDWSTLKDFLWSNPGKHLLLGDFNQVEFAHQKLGGNSVIRGGSESSNYKMDCSLMDSPFHGVHYTWINNRLGSQNIYKQLDRAYCNDT